MHTTAGMALTRLKKKKCNPALPPTSTTANRTKATFLRKFLKIY